MARLTSKTRTSDDDLVIAIDSFAHGEWIIQRGWRLRRFAALRRCLSKPLRR